MGASDRKRRGRRDVEDIADPASGLLTGTDDATKAGGPIHPFRKGRDVKKKEEVVSFIRGEILGRRWPQGTRVTAKRLSEEWDISATPIRAAIEVLVQEGLLTRLGEAGAEVIRVDSLDLFEHLTLRYGIETKIAQKLACTKTPEKIRAMNVIVAKMEAIVGQPKDSELWLGYYDADIEFHRTMARLATMPTAADWVVQLMNRFLVHTRDGREIGKTVLSEHKRIIEKIDAFGDSGPALRERDFRRIQSAVRAHMRGTAERWAVDILPLIDDTWDGKRDRDLDDDSGSEGTTSVKAGKKSKVK